MNSAAEVAWVSWETACWYLNGVNGEKQEQWWILWGMMQWSKLGREDELQSRGVGASMSSGASPSKPSHHGAFSDGSRNCKIPTTSLQSLYLHSASEIQSVFKPARM